jgi:hypothetical protein
VNAERRTSIPSYLILSLRARTSRPNDARLREPQGRGWYAPLVAAALGLVGLIVAAIALLAVLTATSPQTRRPAATLRQPEHVEELVPGTERMRTER